MRCFVGLLGSFRVDARPFLPKKNPKTWQRDKNKILAGPGPTFSGSFVPVQGWIPSNWNQEKPIFEVKGGLLAFRQYKNIKFTKYLPLLARFPQKGGQGICLVKIEQDLVHILHKFFNNLALLYTSTHNKSKNDKNEKMTKV